MSGYTDGVQKTISEKSMNKGLDYTAIGKVDPNNGEGLLFLISATGLVLWALRGHAQMPLALSVHLGSVMALFATLPYSKFAHGIYRTASLLRHAVEKRQPNRLGLGGE